MPMFYSDETIRNAIRAADEEGARREAERAKMVQAAAKEQVDRHLGRHRPSQSQVHTADSLRTGFAGGAFRDFELEMMEKQMNEGKG